MTTTAIAFGGESTVALASPIVQPKSITMSISYRSFCLLVSIAAGLFRSVSAASAQSRSIYSPTSSCLETAKSYLNLVLEKKFDQKCMDTFHNTLTTYIASCIRAKEAVSEQLTELLLKHKTLNIVACICNTKWAATANHTLLFTNAKRRHLKRFFADLNQRFTSLERDEKTIVKMYQNLVPLFEWEETISLFTQHDTQPLMVEFVRQIVKGRFKSTGRELLQVFEDYRVRCKEALEGAAHNPVAKDESVPLDNSGKRSMKANREAARKQRRRESMVYEPMDINFSSLGDLFAYYTDYLLQFHRAFPGLSVKLDEQDSLLVACSFCDSTHKVNYRSISPTCSILYELGRYFSNLEDAIKVLSRKLYKDCIANEKTTSSTWLEKIYALGKFVMLPYRECYASLDTHSICAFPKYSVLFYSTVFGNLLYSTTEFAPFKNFANIIETLYSTMLQGKFSELSELKFSNIANFPQINSSFNTEFLLSAPKLYGQFGLEYGLNEFMLKISEFFFLYKLLLRVSMKLKQHVQQTARPSPINEKCQICLEGPTVDDPLIHPLCDCHFYNYHVNCYVKFLFMIDFQCLRCFQAFVNEEFLLAYLKSYDLTIVDTLNFEPFPIRPFGNGAILMQDIIAWNQMPKDIKRQMQLRRMNVRNSLASYAVFLTLFPERGLATLSEEYTKNPTQVMQMCKANYAKLILWVQAFLKRHSRDGVFSDEDIESNDVWASYWTDMWDSVTQSPDEKIIELLTPTSRRQYPAVQ